MSLPAEVAFRLSFFCRRGGAAATCSDLLLRAASGVSVSAASATATASQGPLVHTWSSKEPYNAARTACRPALALAGGPRLPFRRDSAPGISPGVRAQPHRLQKYAATRTYLYNAAKSGARATRNTSLPAAAAAAQAPHPRIAAGVQAARRRPVYFPGDLSLRAFIWVYKQSAARRATGTRTSRRSSPAASSSSCRVLRRVLQPVLH